MDLNQLQKLTDLRKQRSHAKLADLLDQEARLRADLARLRTMARETQSAHPEHAPLRAIGGDVIWLKWVSETTRQLNTELAQVLAKKEALMDAHKRAVGKDAVARNLANDEQIRKRAAHRKAELNKAIEQSLLR